MRVRQNKTKQEEIRSERRDEIRRSHDERQERKEG